MRSESRSRAGASLLGLLLLVHLGSGFLHPCCLGLAAVESAAQASHGDHGDRGDHGAVAATENAHGVAGHHGPASEAPGGEEGECEGSCGLCCSTVDQVAVASPISAPDRVLESLDVERSRLYAAVLPPTPAFLLPFATAPPGSSPLPS